MIEDITELTSADDADVANVPLETTAELEPPATAN